MAQAVDLNELANMPGFGTAKAQLQKSGYWDEHAGAGPEREFSVRIQAAVTATATITVKARSIAEAEKKAEKRIEDGLVEWDVDSSDVDVDWMEAVDSKEER